MSKLLKYSLKIFAALCLVVTLFMIGVITLIDPNQFKDRIKNHIAKTTGQVLAINGPLSWHILPNLSLQAQDLVLDTPSNLSNNTFTIKKIGFKPRLWTLLSGKLLVDIHIQGLNANLNRSVAGHSIWEHIQTIPIFHTKQKISSLKLLPYHFTVEDGTIHWKDEATVQNLNFKNINISAQKISLGAAGFDAPLNISFELEDVNYGRSGKFSVKAIWAFNHKTQQLNIQNIECNTSFSDLPFNMLLGNLQIQNLQNPLRVVGSIHIPNLSLQYGLSHFNLPVYPLTSNTADLKGSFTYESPILAITAFNLALENEASLTGAFNMDLQYRTLKTLNLSGSFEGKNLRIASLPVPEVKTTLEAKNGIFIFDHIKAQLASSHHKAKIQINIQEDVPQIILSDEMNSFEINELLARLNEKDKIYGNIEAKLNLTTQGNSLSTLLQHLSGKAYIHLTDGRIRGIDLSPLLRHAQSTIVMLKDTLSKRNSINVGAILTAELGEWRLQAMNVDPLVTPFRHLETNITFDNGRAYTSDFKLTHPEYTVNGHGVVDLIQKNVDYQALALLSHAKPTPSPQLSLFLKETPLAIQIKGSFDNLSIQPNLAHYADGAINLVHKESTETATDHGLEKLFGFP